MKVTFLVGNGFDISCGIDTSYNGFYQWYCNKDDNPPDHIKEFRKNILEDLEEKQEERTWADFELGLGAYTNRFTINTIDLFWECYDDALINLQEYIKEQERMIPSQISSEQRDLFVNSILELQKEVSPKDQNIISKMLPKRTNADVVYRFVSFNYTGILDRLVQESSKNKVATWSNGSGSFIAKIYSKVVHVHGQLEDGALLGVDNIMQIQNKDFREDYQIQQCLVKKSASMALGEMAQIDAQNTIDSSDIICLYGLSIGDTDAQWWERVMNWLGSNKEHRLIICWYTKGKISRTAVRKLLNTQKQVKERIASFSSMTTEQLETIYEQISVVFDPKYILKTEFAKNSQELLTVNE